MGICVTDDQSETLAPTCEVPMVKRQSFSSLYKEDEVLGKGAFGEVRKVVRKDGSSGARAVKKTRLSRGSGKWQAEMLASLDHPNIVKVYQIIQDGLDVYMVTQLLADDLASRYAKQLPLSQRRASQLLAQVLSALAYCHGRGLAHLDVKLQNVLFQAKDPKARVKLVDFGQAELRSLHSKQICGTLTYMSPQTFRLKPSCKSDIWAAGVMLFKIVVGVSPFNHRNGKDLQEQLQQGRHLQLLESSVLSQQAKDLIIAMLSQDQSSRPSAQKCLAYPWFKTFQPAASVLRIRRRSKMLQDQQPDLLRQSLKKYMINCFIDNQQKQEIEQQFAALDRQGTGVVDSQIFEAYIRQSRGNGSFFRLSPEEDVPFSEFLVQLADMKYIATEGNIARVMESIRAVPAPLTLAKLQSFCRSEQAYDKRLWGALLAQEGAERELQPEEVEARLGQLVQ